MVCTYCGGRTEVVNSRVQRRRNRVWRRRRCLRCRATVSSIEQVVYEDALAVRDGTSHIMPFQRDVLFLDIYEACRHRNGAVSDASAITDTVLARLIPSTTAEAIIEREAIVAATSVTLRQFDAAAYTHYLAFHPLRG